MYNNYINDGFITNAKKINSLDTYKSSLGDANTKLSYSSSNKLAMKFSTKQEKDCYEIKIEVHGVEDIQISYEKLTGLIVKGSKETLNGRKDMKNTFAIDEDIYDLEQLSASIHKGILTICIGKKEEYKEKVLCTLKNEESVVLSDKGKSKITCSNNKFSLKVKDEIINETIKRISDDLCI